MASRPCWRCIARSLHNPLRPSIPVPFALTSANFSTTPQSLAAAGRVGAKAKRRGGGPAKTADKGKRPATGERKAFRKRIVLSNTNAIEVSGIQDLNEQNCADTETVGKIVGLQGPIVDSLRAVEAFKPSQGWGFFRRPTTLFRNETLEFGKHVASLRDSAEQPGTLRKIITGERGVGKSILLVQAQAIAFSMGWVVMHLPEGQDITNATTYYGPAPDTSPPKYIQKKYISQLLDRTAKANEPILSSLTSLLTHNLPIPVQSNISLTRLAELGAQDPDIAWPIFQALWNELMIPHQPTTASQQQGENASAVKADPKQRRPPILLSLDALPHVSRLSEYLTPSMHFIHAYDLVIIDHFMSHLSGAQSLTNGGMVLGVDSFSNRPNSPSLDLAIRQSEARTAGSSSTNPFLLPSPGTGSASASAAQDTTVQSQSPLTEMPLHDPTNPYAKLDERVLSAMRNVDIVRLGGFNRDHAKTMLEYYARSGMLRQAVTEKMVTERWILSGGGNVGELERGSVRAGL